MKRLGVIGCGDIWQRGHWPALQQAVDWLQVKYVCDVDAEAASRAASLTGAKALVRSDALFDDPEVDIVAVLTPPKHHLELARRAAETGKHLMLEKPMARTLPEARAIVGVIQASQLRCLVPFVRALSASWRAAAQQIVGGAFGEPLAFSASCVATPYDWVPLEHWMHDEAESGGPLFDYSVHWMDLAQACLGSAAESVHYEGVKTGRLRCEDHAQLSVRFAGAKLAAFTRSWACPRQAPYFADATYVVCERALVVFGEQVVAHTETGRVELSYTAQAGEDGRLGSYRELARAIDEKRATFSDEVAGLRMAEILDAMERSRASRGSEAVSRADG